MLRCPVTLILLIWFTQTCHRPLHVVRAAVACNSSTRCEEILLEGSECLGSGYCSNPFHKGGCLNRMKPGFDKNTRICTSEDSPAAAERGHCHLPNPGLDYMEIRIAGQNWESSFFQAWILQILLTELLHVPATVDTGSPDARLDFYDPASPFDYHGKAYQWEGVRVANEIGDCRLLLQKNNPGGCTHIIPEVWNGHQENLKLLEDDGVIERPLGSGVLGEGGWFIPRFTGERDPTLLTHFGMTGQNNRRKVAESFLRPTTWKDYCDLVSPNHCSTDDGVARRAPQDESENSRMFVEGSYTGHFRATEKNDCDAYPTTCTGHIVDYPCGWSSTVRQQTYHLNIPLESDGDEPVSGGYTYSQMTEIWAAANATKSNVVMNWWKPEALYETYVGTAAEFQRVTLPPPTQKCVNARINPLYRCSENVPLEEIVGDADGACDEPPQILQKVITNQLYHSTYDPSIPEAKRSPGYETLKAFSLSQLQVGEIFNLWLKRGSDKWNFDPRAATCRWVVDNFDFISSFIPKTYPRVIQENEDYFTKPLFYISLVFAVVAMSIVLLSMFGTYKYRKKRAIVYAQIEFLCLLLVGLMLVSVAALVLAIPPTDACCSLVIWFTNLGYTLELVPLIVKVAAISRLVSAARRMKRVVLKRKNLFGVVFVLSFLMVIYLILWTTLDPPRKHAEYQLTDKETESGETVVVTSYYCRSESDVWMYLSIGWQTLLLIWATVLAFQTRNLQREINDSMVLAILIYSHFVFVVLRLVTFSLSDELDGWNVARYQSLILSADTCATCCIYFFPKFFNQEDIRRAYLRWGLSRDRSDSPFSVRPEPTTTNRDEEHPGEDAVEGTDTTNTDNFDEHLQKKSERNDEETSR